MAHFLKLTPRKPAGAFLITDVTEEQRDTLMCAHCGMHWKEKAIPAQAHWH